MLEGSPSSDNLVFTGFWLQNILFSGSKIKGEPTEDQGQCHYVVCP